MGFSTLPTIIAKSNSLSITANTNGRLTGTLIGSKNCCAYPKTIFQLKLSIDNLFIIHRHRSLNQVQIIIYNKSHTFYYVIYVAQHIMNKEW